MLKNLQFSAEKIAVALSIFQPVQQFLLFRVLSRTDGQVNNTFKRDIIPDNDPERLAALGRYHLLDTPAERVFDNMTDLAAATFQAPVALISLVGAETVFFKATTGVGKVRCADRGESLCALAILSPEPLVYENTLEDPVVADSVPVKQGVRFYAGAPLSTPDGYLIGTLCVAGFEPRSFSPQDRLVLEALARVVMEQMDLRLGVIRETELQKELLEKKDEFISVASHELKTPITSLTASIQLLDRLRNNPDPKLLDRLVTQANKSLAKLNRLVADLLNTSRIASGHLELRKTVFKPAELARDCCNHVRSEGKFEIMVEGDQNVEVFADEQKIDQVLVNFVNNAAKYAPDSLQILIRISRETGFVRIAVTDKGPGISPDHLPHIFERYYRSAQHNNSGLGLGLYICAEIIRRHGGDIGAISKPGEGSTFWFTLPLAP